MQTKPTQPTNGALATAIAARNAAREKVTAAKSALERGQRNADQVLADVQRHESAIENAQGEHARAVERFIVEGDDGVPPTYLPDARTEKALQSARSQKAVVDRALGALSASCQSAEATLAAAEALVRKEVETLLVGEARALAAQIIEHEEQALRVRERIIALSDLHFTGHLRPSAGPTLPYEVTATLYRRKENPSFTCPIPLYADEFGGAGPHRVRIANEVQRWQQHIEALAAGEGTEQTEPPRAA